MLEFLDRVVPAPMSTCRHMIAPMVKRIGTRAGVLIALCLPGQIHAQEWWQGNWAAEPSWCAMVDQIGSVTPAPIALTATEVVGYENSCSITSVRDMPKVAATQLTLRCQSEGSSFVEDRLVMAGENSSLWMWFGYGDPIRFHRCD